MGYIKLLRREVTDGIGLGWLLALVIGGGILLFTALGLLMAWRIRSRGQQCTTRVYAMDNPDSAEEHEMQPGTMSRQESSRALGSLTASSTTRLVKKRIAESGSTSWSRMSSKTFLPGHVPPVLPPLPTHHSFLGRGLFGSGKNESNNEDSGNNNERVEKRQTRPRMGSITNWVDEEALHGPPIKRMSFRDSWFSKDAWLLRSPTLPSLMSGIETKDEEQPQQLQAPPPSRDNQQQQQPGQHIQVQKRQDKINISLTAPQLSLQDERGRQRVIAQTQNPPVRPCATETDLRDILASTEQRLRDGTSRSPDKRMTPSRSGRGALLGRMTPSPSKRNVTSTPNSPSKKVISRDGSTSSLGSAANSLIKAATEELELEIAGGGSPRRRDWEPLRSRPEEEHTRRRSSSTNSDASSSLSTLYSVGEPEDRDHQAPAAAATGVAVAPRNGDDPFFDTPGGQQRTLHIMGPRPLRRSKTVNVAPRAMTDESAIPAPLRTISVNSRIGRTVGKDDAKNEPFRLSVLRQSVRPDEGIPRGVVKPKETVVAAKRESLSATSSESSMVSVSVHSVSTVMDPPARRAQESSPTPTPSGAIDLSTLMMNVNKQPRNLPTPPPSRIFALRDSSTITPLSPRPQSRHGPTSPLVTMTPPGSQQLPFGPCSSSGGLGAFPAPSRRNSTSSSVYDQDSVSTTIFEDEATNSPLPGRGQGSNALKTVGSTVAELRRMNSVYSVASAASTYFR